MQDPATPPEDPFDEGTPLDEPTTPNPPPTAPQTYTVIRGDTLYSISRRFNLTVEKLKALNGLSSNLIRPGQVLRLK
ncbi:MAG: LysM peptidoglycan-binding domain-containing protein [Bacteroidetes bacterium]|nr:MAG: LysM peptidoglycan-binding domain-containing protein [Bacteroidota bacterium]